MQERISGIENTMEEIDSSVKENIKSNKSLAQNIREIGNIRKRSSLWLRGIDEREDVQLQGTENTFKKIIEENFPNLKKTMPMKIQDTYRTPNRLDQKSTHTT